MTCAMSKKNLLAAMLVLGASVYPLASQAQDSGNVFEGWSGTASLGATSSTGNSEASNINGSIRLSKTVNRWEHLLFGSIFKGTSSIIIVDRDPATGEPILNADGQPNRRIVNGDNSDRLALGYQPKFYYNPKTYFFGIIDWEQDKPGNIDTATRQIGGVGYRFYANVTFNADLRSDFGSDNTFVELGLGVAFKISEKLAFKVAHFSRSNSDLTSPDSLTDSGSDSVTTINLVIDI